MYQLHFFCPDTSRYRIRLFRTLNMSIGRAHQLALTTYSITLNGAVIVSIGGSYEA